MVVTYGDWFTGFGGASIGAKMAGLDIVFGAEYREDVAGVYRQNLGDHIRVCDLTAVSVEAFPYVEIFHASPPCPNFSTAKANAEETTNDLMLASKISEYIAYHRPRIFTLENVYQYRNSKSWGMIAQALLTHGYQFNYWHVNMADYGVPQTRTRMIVIARCDGIRPMLPRGTHAKDPQTGLFETLKPWVSWYDAIEDLIPSLPDSQFADWQLSRLPDELAESICYINPNVNTNGDGFRYASAPSTTIPVTRMESTARAFIIDGKLSTNGDTKQLQINGQTTPMGTVVSSYSAMKDAKGYANGRIVKMTPRALARFQSFPDSYELPANNKLAAYGIGNALPPLFAQRLYEALT